MSPWRGLSVERKACNSSCSRSRHPNAIALGLLDQTVSKVVFETLYEGKKVILCPDGRLSKPGIPQGLRCFIEEYLQKCMVWVV